MLRLLASGFAMLGGDDGTRRADKRAAIESAIGVMGLVRSLAGLLTTLPADHGPGTAGMNFHLPRSTLALPQRHAGKVLLAERAREIADALDRLAIEIPGLDKSLAKRLISVAERLDKGDPETNGCGSR